VILGALAATSGRSVLMWASQRFSSRLPARLAGNLYAARQLLEGKKRGLVVLVSAFILSPLPSAQLFVAAGLLHLPRRVVVGAFCAGRLVTYSLYIGVATTVDSRFNHLFKDLLGSPWSIATQLALLLILALVPLINWNRFIR
jgi:membrane protein YqaA with SNARE-associated domain